MKVSHEQKIEIRRRLLTAAVELFTEKGFTGATMREISTRAGYSPGTIYNYFSTKDGIFYAYFEETQEELFRLTAAMPDFHDFDLKEKLQAVIETQLEVYGPDREFVEITYRALLDSPMRSFTALSVVQERFADAVRPYFLEAVEKGTIGPQPFLSFLVHLFWDYKNLMVLYWLKDDSPGFVQTSRLVDMSLDVFTDVIRTGIISKSFDILTFLLRSHLFGNLDRWYRLVSMLSELGGRDRSAWGGDRG